MKTRKMVMASLYAALVCIATLIIQIPIPATKGYIHLGDSLIILSGVLLNPTYAALAAGIGSALADVFGGYAIYAPATFIIKGLVGFVCGLVCKKIRKTNVSILVSGLVDLLFVTGGYYLYEGIMFGFVVALPGVLGNVVQCIGGCIIAILIYPALAMVIKRKS